MNKKNYEIKFGCVLIHLPLPHFHYRVKQQSYSIWSDVPKHHYDADSELIELIINQTFSPELLQATHQIFWL